MGPRVPVGRPRATLSTSPREPIGSRSHQSTAMRRTACRTRRRGAAGRLGREPTGSSGASCCRPRRPARRVLGRLVRLPRGRRGRRDRRRGPGSTPGARRGPGSSLSWWSSPHAAVPTGRASASTHASRRRQAGGRAGQAFGVLDHVLDHVEEGRAALRSSRAALCRCSTPVGRSWIVHRDHDGRWASGRHLRAPPTRSAPGRRPSSGRRRAQAGTTGVEPKRMSSRPSWIAAELISRRRSESGSIRLRRWGPRRRTARRCCGSGRARRRR